MYIKEVIVTMKNNKNIAQNIPNGFKVPKNYFESFEDDLFQKLALNSDDVSSNGTGYTVPETYFNNVDEKLLDIVNSTQPVKVIKLLTYKNFAYTASIAAALILMFGLVFNKQKSLDFETLEFATLHYYIETADFSTNDIASLLNDDELSSEIILQEIISDEAIETYLMDTANLQDLLID